MVSKAYCLLALASIVIAHPQRHGRYHPWRSGRPTVSLVPSAAAFPANGTDLGGAPIESPSPVTAVKTVTVQPVPLESSTGDDVEGLSSIANVNAVASSTDSSTSTLTSTSTASANGLEDLLPTSSIDLEGPTPTAAEFFGERPTYGGGYSAPTAQPTTFATVTGGAQTDSAPASIPSTPPSSGGSTGGKKGLSYNDASLTNAFSGKGISWVYNWGAQPDGTVVPGAEYVPMLWGSQSIGAWSGAIQKAISSGAKYALSFNEPDHVEQANMDPATAAKLHIANMNTFAGQVQIGSPAITNGGGSMGTAWLKAFFDACNGQCKVDFVAFHWYDSASNFVYFQNHVQDVINLANANGVSRVWLTEYGASGSDSDVANFIKQSTQFLESTAAVERYAYFMCSNGILVNGQSISSPIGAAYVS